MSSPAALRTNVLLGVCGGIAAYKIAFLASRLVQSGANVRVAMTRHALDFVGAATFEGLTNAKVISSPTQIDPDGSVPHIDAGKAARVYVIAPATAQTLAKLAHGAADDPVALLAITCRCPILVCPAMNDTMWTSPAVRANCDVLRQRGVTFLGPVEGRLAEGYDAIGRMVEPDAILARIAELVAPGEP